MKIKCGICNSGDLTLYFKCFISEDTAVAPPLFARIEKGATVKNLSNKKTNVTLELTDNGIKYPAIYCSKCKKYLNSVVMGSKNTRARDMLIEIPSQKIKAKDFKISLRKITDKEKTIEIAREIANAYEKKQRDFLEELIMQKLSVGGQISQEISSYPLKTLQSFVKSDQHAQGIKLSPLIDMGAEIVERTIQNKEMARRKAALFLTFVMLDDEVKDTTKDATEYLIEKDYYQKSDFTQFQKQGIPINEKILVDMIDNIYL